MSSRQLKLWYLAHPTELALGSHCGFSWTKACFQELTGSSFHSVEKGRSEMEQHSYKPSTIYKLRIPFLLRDWEGAPAACTRYQQVPAAPQDQQSSLGLLWQPHFWWGCRPVPAEPSDKVAVRAEAPRLSTAGFKCQSALKGWSFFTRGLLCVTQEGQCPHHSDMAPSQGQHQTPRKYRGEPRPPLWLSPHRP